MGKSFNLLLHDERIEKVLDECRKIPNFVILVSADIYCESVFGLSSEHLHTFFVYCNAYLEMASDFHSMRKLITICFALLCYNAFAQDLITKKDGTDIQAKVLEVTTNEVKYKLFDDPDGVTYTARKSELLMVRYESGRKDIFSNSSYSSRYTTNREPVMGITPNMKYKQLKSIYNYQEYEERFDDRYNPILSGVASFFIPGLGQMICGEVGRGFAYLGGHIGGMILAPVIMAAGKGAYGYISTEAALAALVIYAGVITLDICAIVDGVRVAKVKNMYEQDLRKHYAIDVDLYPSVNFVQLGNNIRPTAGLTLAIKF